MDYILDLFLHGCEAEVEGCNPVPGIPLGSLNSAGTGQKWEKACPGQGKASASSTAAKSCFTSAGLLGFMLKAQDTRRPPPAPALAPRPAGGAAAGEPGPGAFWPLRAAVPPARLAPP